MIFRLHAAVLSAIFNCGSALAALPDASAVPGGIAQIELGSTASAAPRAFYDNRPVMVRAERDRWIALVGIPLSIEPGRQSVRIEPADGSAPRNLTFAIGAKAYREQRLTIQNQRKVDPNPEDQARIAAEGPRKARARSVFTADPQIDPFPLQLPVRGPFSSPFGLRRFFNGQARSPHSGLDIAAPRGTPVAAAAAGHIVEADDFFFSGNVVFVDHGQGLITLYAHLDRIDVRVGDAVQRGQVIGTVGSTGRVTGPHLHWTVYLNATPVDPLLFVAGADLPAPDETSDTKSR
ncbi:MAG: peptidoglycan DD-metalloendopeptidase family protein [Chromatiales bacterium]|nr:peptidoglycan DD-metalloendopeptidase family protein [Chromatiales bacterium]